MSHLIRSLGGQRKKIERNGLLVEKRNRSTTLAEANKLFFPGSRTNTGGLTAGKMSRSLLMNNH